MLSGCVEIRRETVVSAFGAAQLVWPASEEAGYSTKGEVVRISTAPSDLTLMAA
jgi:hypothetical protein